MISTDKPGTPQELALEHHGVLGMRWGHRKTGGAGARATRRKFRQKNPTAFNRRRTVLSARQRVRSQRFKAHTTKDNVQAMKLHKAYLRNPDRATALRMTRGEKWMTAALGVSVVGTTPAAGYAVGRTVYRHHVERKQARGGYG